MRLRFWVVCHVGHGQCLFAELQSCGHRALHPLRSFDALRSAGGTAWHVHILCACHASVCVHACLCVC